MTDGIANAIPATNVTLNNVIQIIFVVIPINISDNVLVSKASEIKRLIPILPLKRPPNNDTSIPITPNNFTNDAVDISPFTLSDKMYKFKMAYILINIINNVNEMNKQYKTFRLSRKSLKLSKNFTSCTSEFRRGLSGT